MKNEDIWHLKGNFRFISSGSLVGFSLQLLQVLPQLYPLSYKISVFLRKGSSSSASKHAFLLLVLNGKQNSSNQRRLPLWPCFSPLRSGATPRTSCLCPRGPRSLPSSSLHASPTFCAGLWRGRSGLTDGVDSSVLVLLRFGSGPQGPSFPLLRTLP